MATHPPARDAQWPWTEPDAWCGEHPERAVVAGRVQLTRDVLEAANAIRQELGGAEWSDPQHADEILRDLIKRHWRSLADALDAHPLYREAPRG